MKNEDLCLLENGQITRKEKKIIQSKKMNLIQNQNKTIDKAKLKGKVLVVVCHLTRSLGVLRWDPVTDPFILLSASFLSS